MSKGPGRIEEKCLEALKLNTREGVLTIPGQEPRNVKAASARVIMQSIYDTATLSRSQRVSVRRALHELGRAGKIKPFYITENGRRCLYVEDLTPVDIHKQLPDTDIAAIKAALHNRVEQAIKAIQGAASNNITEGYKGRSTSYY